MDLEKDWELLPDEGFLEINDDGSGKQIYSRRYPSMFSGASTTTVFHTNYFICPPKSNPPDQFVDLPKQQQQQLLPVPIDSEPPPTAEEQLKGSAFDADERYQDPAAVSQVFFKKSKEITESVDMIKVMSSRKIVAQIEGNFQQFEEKGGDHSFKVDSADQILTTRGMMKKNIESSISEIELADDHGGSEDGGPSSKSSSSICKWSLTGGVGAICSFGVAAAATLCILIFSSAHRNNGNYPNHNQKLNFQIYTNDNKRMEKRVHLHHHRHHASKLNEAMSAVRGSSVAITTARITFGGYYDAPF